MWSEKQKTPHPPSPVQRFPPFRLLRSSCSPALCYPFHLPPPPPTPPLYLLSMKRVCLRFHTTSSLLLSNQQCVTTAEYRERRTVCEWPVCFDRPSLCGACVRPELLQDTSVTFLHISVFNLHGRRTVGSSEKQSGGVACRWVCKAKQKRNQLSPFSKCGSSAVVLPGSPHHAARS